MRRLNRAIGLVYVLPSRPESAHSLTANILLPQVRRLLVDLDGLNANEPGAPLVQGAERVGQAPEIARMGRDNGLLNAITAMLAAGVPTARGRSR